MNSQTTTYGLPGSASECLNMSDLSPHCENNPVESKGIEAELSLNFLYQDKWSGLKLNVTASLSRSCKHEKDDPLSSFFSYLEEIAGSKDTGNKPISTSFKKNMRKRILEDPFLDINNRAEHKNGIYLISISETREDGYVSDIDMRSVVELWERSHFRPSFCKDLALDQKTSGPQKQDIAMEKQYTHEEKECRWNYFRKYTTDIPRILDTALLEYAVQFIDKLSESKDTQENEDVQNGMEESQQYMNFIDIFITYLARTCVDTDSL